MTYTWITPKTDWTYRDKFTYTDYNRIRNNILYINEKINELFPELYMELDLGEPKTSYYDEYFPSEFNKFEDAIISFERTGVNYNIGERYYHYDNDPFVWEDVLNRLETCLLRWKKVDKVAIQNIYLRPHGEEHILMYIGDSALFDVVIEPSNATNKNSWTLDNDGDMYVSKYLTCEKISDTQVRVTYTKGRGENAYNNGSDDAQKMFMVEDKNSLTDTSGYNCSESIYTNYIKVKVEKLKAKCPCHYLAQGSYINRKEDNGKNTRQYYKFKKIADNVDGRDITTFQMILTDIYAMPFGYENRSDANAPWRKAFDGIHFWSFSKDLRDSMQSVQKEVMSSATAKTNYSSKFHLPSFKEFGSNSNNVVTLGSAYPYLSGNELTYNGNALGIEHDNYESCHDVATRSLFNASSLTEVGLSSDKRKALLASRTSYINSFKPSCACGIFPMVFLPSTLKVVEYLGNYKIDWSGTSSIELSDIPLGSVVFDADGNKGDYSSYNHITAINLSKTSISMKETAVQTITISVFPLTAQNVQKLNVYTDIPDKIGLDYSGNTITVTGIKMGIGHIYVEADEFPNDIVRAVCTIKIEDNTIHVDDIEFVVGTGLSKNGLMLIGVTYNLNVKVTPANATNASKYTISSSNNDIVEVTTAKQLKVIAHKENSKFGGNARITTELEGHNDIINVSSLLCPTTSEVGSSPSFISFNGSIYSLGGYRLLGADSIDSDKDLYFFSWDSQNLTWNRLSNLPCSVQYYSFVVYHNELHMIGRDDLKEQNKSYHYKWNGTSWTLVDTIPTGMKYPVLVVYNDEIHILGTRGNNSLEHYKWNGTSWTLVGNIPNNTSSNYPRFLTRYAVVYNNEIYLLSTYYNSSAGVSSYAYYFYKWDGVSWTLLKNKTKMKHSYGEMFIYNNSLLAPFDEGSGSLNMLFEKWNGIDWENSKVDFSEMLYSHAFSFGKIIVYDNKLYTFVTGSYRYLIDGVWKTIYGISMAIVKYNE